MKAMFRAIWTTIESLILAIGGFAKSIENTVDTMNNITGTACDMSETFRLEQALDTVQARATIKAAYEKLGITYVEPTDNLPTTDK